MSVWHSHSFRWKSNNSFSWVYCLYWFHGSWFWNQKCKNKIKEDQPNEKFLGWACQSKLLMPVEERDSEIWKQLVKNQVFVHSVIKCVNLLLIQND